MTMRLVVEIFTGSLFYIEVSGDCTVASLKKQIEAQENLPHDRLIILLHDDSCNVNRTLTEDDAEASLHELGIQDGSHIYILFKPLEEIINDGSSGCSTTGGGGGGGSNSNDSTKAQSWVPHSNGGADAPNSKDQD